MQAQTFGFIGLGLIGGSIAKALRKNDPNCIIIAYDKEPAVLLQAKREGIVNISCNQIDQTFHPCDYLFLCTPVSYNNEYLKMLKEIRKSDCILTDVGSVKCPIHEQIRSLSLCDCFIGGHPMAGSEHSGYSNSNAGLLENAYYILTPASEVPVEKINAFSNLIHSIHALPLVMDAQIHDHATAAISHLPHMIAFSLVNLIQKADDPKGIMKMIAAGGFKDITRIASSSPIMWQQICLENKEQILTMMDAYKDMFDTLYEMIRTDDREKLFYFFESSETYRNSFNDVISGPIPRIHHLTVSVPDEAGAIAKISGLCAKENINIKNIGIVHSREFEEGVLRIEFYDDFSLQNAISLLRREHYHIYTK